MRLFYKNNLHVNEGRVENNYVPGHYTKELMEISSKNIWSKVTCMFRTHATSVRHVY
jgi:hypothetical protein